MRLWSILMINIYFINEKHNNKNHMIFIMLSLAIEYHWCLLYMQVEALLKRVKALLKRWDNWFVHIKLKL